MASFPGAVVTPDDPRYPTLVRGYNLRWVGTPASVVLCGSTAQVVRAVEDALAAGRRITVRGGGHCYEDFVSGNDGGVIIDLSPLGDVSREEDGTYCIEGGATLWNAYTRLEREYGVTIPGGSCYSVGAGGHVPAGGYGLLSRLHGLTVDFLEAVEVVVVAADGTVDVVVARAGTGDPDLDLLLWAHQGGGGGNFGIVTRYWFREPPAAPAEATLLTLTWDWAGLDRAGLGALLAAYGAYHAARSAPGDPASSLFALLALNQASPDAAVVLTAQDVGGDPDVLRDFQAQMTGPGIPAPAIGGQTLPWLHATQTLNGSGSPRRAKYKSAYMNEPFPEAQIDAIWAALRAPVPASPQALLQVDSYGGQINAVAPDATAVAARSSVMKLQYQVYWQDPSDDDACLGWIRSFYDGMYCAAGPVPDGTMDGCYVGYPDVDLGDWQHLYYQGNYPRLQQAKGRWDPLDTFNHAQSIELPAAGS